MAILQIISKYKDGHNYYFYRTQDGAAMDLITAKGGLPLQAIAIKISNSSILTKSNYYAYDAVNVKKNFVITSG